jgi:hypothetical protein
MGGFLVMAHLEKVVAGWEKGVFNASIPSCLIWLGVSSLL